MAQNKTKKRSLWKSLWKDKATRYGICSFVATITLLIIFVLIPRKTTVMRNGHTLQVYSTQYAPVHDPLMCPKCIQENKGKNQTDTIDDNIY